MTSASISGTTHSVAHNGGVDGAVLFRSSDTVTVECGMAGLTAVVTITPGASVEFAPCDSQDQVTGGWVTYAPGQSFALNPGDRRVGRMVGAGGSGVRVQFSGPALAKMAGYDGTRGSLG